MMPHGDGAQGLSAPRRREGHLALFVLLLCGGYLAALWWIDRGNGTFARLGAIWPLLLLAMLPVSVSYLFRFWRWRWLLQRQGHAVPFGLGWAAYLAGFALTATPGKAGNCCASAISPAWACRRGARWRCSCSSEPPIYW